MKIISKIKSFKEIVSNKRCDDSKVYYTRNDTIKDGYDKMISYDNLEYIYKKLKEENII